LNWQGHLSRGLRAETLRTVLLLIVLLAGGIVFAATVARHHAIHRWLVWRYSGYWGLTVFWAAGCLSAGSALLARLDFRQLGLGDKLVLAFPLGVFAFVTAIFVLGLLHLLSWVTFVLLPLVFLASGVRHLGAAARHAWALSSGVGRKELPLLLFGLAGFALLYFQILSPEAFSYDARWYHLPIAEQYARQGAIRAFPEGWWLGAYPHLASYLQTWSFLLPHGMLFDRLELCIHLEFATFVATVLSIPALVRRLLAAEQARFSWVSMFIFPGVFLYDGNLCAGADHFAAFWMVPMALALTDLWRTWDLRMGLLLSLFASAVMLTKYSAWAALPFPAALVLGRGCWLMLRGPATGSRVVKRAQIAKGLALMTIAVLVFTAPHWLKNWIWYGDPAYPALRHVFDAHPWNPDAGESWQVFDGMRWRPRPGAMGVLRALSAAVSFSFIPHNWDVLHGKRPIFGSLFTLTAVCLPMLRARAELWLTSLAVMAAVVFWYLLHHQDRYLQAFVPWMAACTAASISLIWQTGRRTLRAALATLVALQLAWAADVPFFPSHNLIGTTPYSLSLALASSGFTQTPKRFRLYGSFGEIGEVMPPDANVLVHDSPLHLGINARSVQDQWQGRISYAQLRTPAAIHRELRDLGITHVLWEPGFSHGWSSLANDLAFWNFAWNHGGARQQFSELAVSLMPDDEPPDELNDRVAVFTCGDAMPTGWYRLRDVNVPPGRPAKPNRASGAPSLAGALETAGFLVLETRCAPTLPGNVNEAFHPPASRGELMVYVRRAAESSASADAKPAVGLTPGID
jgi:hypothetical protein